jgi:hypothetical protein
MLGGGFLSRAWTWFAGITEQIVADLRWMNAIASCFFHKVTKKQQLSLAKLEQIANQTDRFVE